MQLTIQKETFAGKILDKIALEIHQESLTVAELIRLKVEQEVKQHNETLLKENQGFQNATEQRLNQSANYPPQIQRKLADPEKEAYRAWEAFQNNQVFLLIDKKQAESLEQEILLSKDTQISFMELMPLVGG